MKELKLDKDVLTDGKELRFKRGRPVATVECRMTTRGFPILPMYFEQQISELKNKRKLRDDLEYGYLVASRIEIDETGTVQMSFGSVERRHLEVCKIEIYSIV